MGSTPMTGHISYGLENGDYFAIGHPVNLCGDYDPQFTGDIDEVRVWSRALTAAEIAALATPKQGRR